MDNTKTWAVSLFIGISFYLGFGYSLLLSITNTDALISLILGSTVGFGIIWGLEYLKEKWVSNNVLNRILITIFSLFLYSQIVFIFQTFASSFFLLKTPIWFLGLPIPFLIYKISKHGVKTIGLLAESLIPIVLFLILLTYFGLLKNIKLDYLTPIFKTNTIDILKGSLLVAMYSSAPYFLLLNIPLDKNKLKVKFLVCQILLTITCFFIITTLGPNLISIYRYPEYMLLKEINIFNFMEKVENIISIAWLFSLFILLSLCGYNLKENLQFKNKDYLFIISLILLYLFSLLESTHYIEELKVYYILMYIFLGFISSFFIINLLTRKKIS